MEQAEIERLADQISDLLKERLRVRGKTLSVRIKRAGRLLPKVVRRAAAELVYAQDMAQNPKLAMKLDSQAIGRAFDTCQKHLNGIDAKAARIRAIYNFAALIAGQVLIVVAAAIAVMNWRGLI
ncbi:MAG: hypothetical protein ABJ327_21140 [Litoreibacter sp.]